MVKFSNDFKFLGTGILGFCAGVIVYIIVALLLAKIFGGGGTGGEAWICIFAIFTFPFVGIPLALFFANIAIAREKIKVDKTSNPSERKSNKVFLITSIVISIILIVVVRIAVTNGIRKAVSVSYPDGILKTCSSGIYEETSFKGGKRDGVHKIFCKQNSQMRWEDDWKNGERIKGSNRCYDENGNLIGSMGEYEFIEKYCR